MLIETQYLPSIDTFIAASKDKILYIEAHENYQKKSYRNRCHILGSNGIITLSVPLQKGKHLQKPIKDVTISYDENWPKLHVQAITSAYQSSPFFDFYKNEIFDIIESKPVTLYELNWRLLEFICDKMDVILCETSEYQRDVEIDMDLRSKIRPNHPIYQNLQFYGQVFTDRFGFTPNLSIIDLLFCRGPEAVIYVNQQL